MTWITRLSCYVQETLISSTVARQRNPLHDAAKTLSCWDSFQHGFVRLSSGRISVVLVSWFSVATLPVSSSCSAVLSGIKRVRDLLHKVPQKHK